VAELTAKGLRAAAFKADQGDPPQVEALIAKSTPVRRPHPHWRANTSRTKRWRGGFGDTPLSSPPSAGSPRPCTPETQPSTLCLHTFGSTSSQHFNRCSTPP